MLEREKTIRYACPGVICSTVEAGMTNKVIYLYPREFPRQKQKEVYLRFYRAHQNTEGARKRAMREVLTYFIGHWGISLKIQSAWVTPIKRDRIML